MSNEKSLVCNLCVKDEILKGEIVQRSTKGTCTYCGTEDIFCIPLEELATRIDAVLQSNYRMSNHGYLPVVELIAELAGLSAELSEEVRCVLEPLSFQEHWDDGLWEDGLWDVGPYDSNAYYEEGGSAQADDLNGWDGLDGWDHFRFQVTRRSRFSNESSQFLGWIFSRLGEFATYSRSRIIRKITPSTEDRFIYRARVATSEKELREILSSPEQQLGPPPFGKATAGRMNATGISVFYGALEVETCIDEVRPPVGSAVVTGRFEIIRPLCILDFDALASAYTPLSMFHQDYQPRSEQSAFLCRAVQEMSGPVLPHEAEIEYLPTQIVAEYLAHRAEPNFDGLIFSSTQSSHQTDDGSEQQGHNFVLFHHASSVETLGAKYKVKGLVWPIKDYDDVDTDDTIWMNRALEEKSSAGEFNHVDNLLLDIPDFTEPSDYASASEYDLPALRLDLKSLKVWGITSVKHKTHAAFMIIP